MATFSRSLALRGLCLRRRDDQRLPSRLDCGFRHRLAQHLREAAVDYFDATSHRHHRRLIPLRHQRPDVLGRSVTLGWLQRDWLQSSIDRLGTLLCAELFDQYGVGYGVEEEVKSISQKR